MTFMRAHGNSPGPTQRPYLAGATSAALGAMLALALLYATGAGKQLAQSLGMPEYGALSLVAASAIVAGLVYGRVFSRAANDARGGWLFGISFGYVLWMLGPTVVLQWFRGEPLVVGRDAMAVLGAHLLYGLALGLAYPYVQKLMKRRQLHTEHVKPYASAAKEQTQTRPAMR